MMKLTPRQLDVLSKAAAREDGIAPIPDKMPKAAQAKLSASLVSLKLMREILAKRDMPIWHRDNSDRPLSLIITKAGRTALKVNNGDDGIAVLTKPDIGASMSGQIANASHRQQDQRPKKRQIVMHMLSADHGVTLEALRRATGWLPHTIRAMLSRLRKQGLQIERRGSKGAQTATYHLLTSMPAQA